MEKIFTLLVFLFLCLTTHSQIVFNGHVYDAGNQRDVSNAEISILNRHVVTQSNVFGAFLLKYGDTDESNFQFLGNSIFWQGNRHLKLEIISLGGRLIYKDVVVAGNSYLFPRLKRGLYILQLTEGGQISTYKLLSENGETVHVDTRGISHTHSGSLGAYDTLLIEKEGYYSRKIAVGSSSQVIDIAMLKGSYDNLDYFNELIAPVAFDLISHKPSRSNLGDVQQVKLVYDVEKDKLYYMNSQKYELHLQFATDVLGFDKGHAYFNQTQYRDNPNRYLYLASLYYYKGIDKYVLQYVAAVEMSCEQIERLYNKIINTSFLTREQLSFFPIKPEWEKCVSVSKVNSEDLYEGQIYQGLNIADNYGYLKKISAENLSAYSASRRDLILTDGIPNDLPVVAGIITTDLQTPLSHINVLSHSRNTPNMALRSAWDDTGMNDLVDKLVYLNVEPSGYELREANLTEAQAFWTKKEPSVTTILAKNITYKELIPMEDAGISYLDRIGGKAANFSELLNLPGLKEATPEKAFAIPFFYYHEHMQKYGLNIWLTQMMSETLFQTDAAYRKVSLQALQDSIIVSPLDPELVLSVQEKINYFSDFDAFRFRSSTNAEDLEVFSGAGLYNSYSAKKGHSTKTVDHAIKKVWASLWNWRAFEERDYFKIYHQSCMMGVLVHRSFPDEDANGVLVTKNLYNSNPGYIINVQHKEHSIVFPEPGIINDQMILFTWSINPNEKYLLEYLSYSNITGYHNKNVMTDEEVFLLGDYATEIKNHFYYRLPHQCDCTFNDFGVDIEFKVDSDVSPRKVYVKQARLYR